MTEEAAREVIIRDGTPVTVGCSDTGVLGGRPTILDSLPAKYIYISATQFTVTNSILGDSITVAGASAIDKMGSLDANKDFRQPPSDKGWELVLTGASGGPIIMSSNDNKTVTIRTLPLASFSIVPWTPGFLALIFPSDTGLTHSLLEPHLGHHYGETGDLINLHKDPKNGQKMPIQIHFP